MAHFFHYPDQNLIWLPIEKGNTIYPAYSLNSSQNLVKENLNILQEIMFGDKLDFIFKITVSNNQNFLCVNFMSKFLNMLDYIHT